MHCSSIFSRCRLFIVALKETSAFFYSSECVKGITVIALRIVRFSLFPRIGFFVRSEETGLQPSERRCIMHIGIRGAVTEPLLPRTMPAAGRGLVAVIIEWCTYIRWLETKWKVLTRGHSERGAAAAASTLRVRHAVRWRSKKEESERARWKQVRRVVRADWRLRVCEGAETRGLQSRVQGVCATTRRRRPRPPCPDASTHAAAAKGQGCSSLRLSSRFPHGAVTTLLVCLGERGLCVCASETLSLVPLSLYVFCTQTQRCPPALHQAHISPWHPTYFGTYFI